MTVESITIAHGKDKVFGAPYDGGYHEFRKIDFSCVCDSTDGTFDLTVNGDVTGITNGSLEGWRLETVETKTGGTAPTDASDLSITDDTIGLDLLDGNGTDAIDSTTAVGTYCAIDGQAYAFPISGDLTMIFTNQAVHSATVTVRFNLSRARG